MPKATCGDETIQYIEVTPQDIAVANGLAAEVLGRTLDELSPQARRLLILLHDMVSQKCRELAIDRSAYRFTRRDVREAIGWSDYQVRVHLNRLVQLEYVLPHRGSRGQQFVYELLYDGQGREGQPFVTRKDGSEKTTRRGPAASGGGRSDRSPRDGRVAESVPGLTASKEQEGPHGAHRATQLLHRRVRGFGIGQDRGLRPPMGRAGCDD